MVHLQAPSVPVQGVVPWWLDGGWWITSSLAALAALAAIWTVWQGYRDRPRVDWRVYVTGFRTWKDVHIWNIGDASAINVEPLVAFGNPVEVQYGSRPWFYAKIEPGAYQTFRISHLESDEYRVALEIPYLTSPVRHRRKSVLRIDLKTGEFVVSKPNSLRDGAWMGKLSRSRPRRGESEWRRGGAGDAALDLK